MRNQYDNTIDNLVNQVEHRIQKKINRANYGFYDRAERSVRRLRDGVLEFGAFPIENISSGNYATWGFNNSTTVGP